MKTVDLSPVSSEAEVLKFEVLYYPRSKKVHKGRGQKKKDGILSISAPPLSLVTLINSTEDGSSSENEDDETSRKKMKPARKSQARSKVLFSNIHSAISKRAFGKDVDNKLEIDSVVVLSQVSIYVAVH